MPLTIITVGKKHEAWIHDGVERYQKRLKKPWDVRWVLIPHSSFEGQRARQEESERILSQLQDDDIVILLDERGIFLDSPAVSQRLQGYLDQSRRILLVIGGAYGVTDRLGQRADVTWSLSPLVFPHQLVRLIVIEQLYRAQEIALGHPYHHQ